MNLSQQFFKNYWQHIFLNFRDEKFETIRFMMEDKINFKNMLYAHVLASSFDFNFIGVLL